MDSDGECPNSGRNWLALEQLFGSRADSLFQALELVLFEPRREVCHQLLYEARAFVNQRRVDLQQAGASGDFLPGILGAENSPHADEWKLSPCLSVEMTHNFRAEASQWPAAQAARLAVDTL